MSFQNENNRIAFAGDGLTTSLPFPYYFQREEDLVVLLIEDDTLDISELTLDTDFTITGDTDGGVYPDGATVEMTTAALDGFTVVVYCDPLAAQHVIDLVENDSLPADGVEQGLDNLGMIGRRLKELISRAVRLKDGFTGTFDPTLPARLSSGSLLAINAGVNGFDLLSASDLINLAGSLASANNLSDLSNVTTALRNLGIAPYSYQTEHAFTNGQTATDLDGEEFDSADYSSVVFEYEISRGGAVKATGNFSLHFNGTSWDYINGAARLNSPPHGITFSLSGTGTAQLRAAESGIGAGNLKLKKSYFFA